METSDFDYVLPPEHLYPPDEWRIIETRFSDEYVDRAETVDRRTFRPPIRVDRRFRRLRAIYRVRRHVRRAPSCRR